jgi:glucokinase
MLLTADIGGTKTVVAAATPKDNGITLSSIMRFESKNYQSFEAILDDYLARYTTSSAIDLSLAVAGPVIDNRCPLTNLAMNIDGDDLSRRSNVGKVGLINDLEASGYGLQVVPESGIEVIYDGAGDSHGNRVLISPGTGLGESIIHAVGGGFIPLASEGGHTDFAPFDGTSERLWSFLKRQRSRVAVEDVLSGPGIYNIFRFLSSEEGIDPNKDLARQLKSEPGYVITTRALEQNDPLSLRTIHLFLDILAAEAGNMALKAMSRGGVYLGGGILPRLLPIIDRQRFRAVLADKGKHRSLLEQFPIYAVTDTLLPLYGAAQYMIAAVAE